MSGALSQAEEEAGWRGPAVCNICGSRSFGHMGRRLFVRCNGCRSLERTRLAYAVLLKARPKLQDARILHFAPETGLAAALAAAGARLRLFDYEPGLFRGLAVEAFDLCADLASLEDGAHDVILHNHVLEHLATDPISVVNTLTKKLAPGGVQIFSVPVVSGHYREDLSPALSEEERTKRFGQNDHLRVFGRADFETRFLRHVVGATAHDPIDVAEDDGLDALRVPTATRRGYSGNTIVVVHAPR